MQSRTTQYLQHHTASLRPNGSLQHAALFSLPENYPLYVCIDPWFTQQRDVPAPFWQGFRFIGSITLKPSATGSFFQTRK